jgi:hypothetical protein
VRVGVLQSALVVEASLLAAAFLHSQRAESDPSWSACTGGWVRERERERESPCMQWILVCCITCMCHCICVLSHCMPAVRCAVSRTFTLVHKYVYTTVAVSITAQHANTTAVNQHIFSFPSIVALQTLNSSTPPCNTMLSNTTNQPHFFAHIHVRHCSPHSRCSSRAAPAQ